MNPESAAWADLDRELAAWEQAGRTPALWWRDDDAAAPTPALDRLLGLQGKSGVPLCLAIIAEPAGEALARRITESTGVSAAVHGFGHVNHAPSGEKKSEYGRHRPMEVMTAEIAKAWEKVHSLCGERAVPAFVPPWNRMSDDLLPRLPALGLRAISRKAPRPAGEPVRGLTVADVHVDIVDWRGSRTFIGKAAALGQLIAQLRANRSADGAGPVGLLTHHLVMDEPAWDFLARLFGGTAEKPRVRWLSTREAFNLNP